MVAATDTNAYAAGLARNHAFDASSMAEPKTARMEWMPIITLRRVLFISIWVAIQLTILIAKTASGAANGSAFSGYNRGVEGVMMTCLSVNFLLMSPTFLRMLRATRLRHIIPFDRALHAHKFVAYCLLFWILQHVITHYYKFIKQAEASDGKVSATTLLYSTTTGRVGHTMLALLIGMFLAALPVVRRRWFEVFYLLHHLSFVVVMLIFVHIGDHTFQFYIAVPGFIYVVDRIYRTVRARVNQPRILSVIQHPSGVIELRFERNNMKYRAGQYIYLCVPALSWHQWHPFTLTSAPEEGELSVHIRANGGWTGRLVNRLQQCAPLAPPKKRVEHRPMRPGRRPSTLKRTDSVDSNKTLTPSYDHRTQRLPTRSPRAPPGARPGLGGGAGLQREGTLQGGPPGSPRNPRTRYPPDAEYYPPGSNQQYTRAERTVNRIFQNQPRVKLPTIMVDGPYCAPTQAVSDYDHMVLICGNIGVTPMSSVLKSLYYQLTMPKPTTTVKKVYFIWACRDVQALEWFRDLLAALDLEDVGDILEIRTYLTGTMKVDQIRNIALYQDPDGPDAVTGLYRSPTYYGRPDFDRMFGEIGHRCPSTKVGVFFCGSRVLGHRLRRISNKWSRELRARKTSFVFHEELSTL
ncbi:hypothetical protein LPJ61_005768 [Coemansia biformis]|uniref:FAD-binding FR-type domain-containing protein n=1 Tax=Coemansia biformis TaxID=1286918 RepID=A0A9W7XZS7_9FUNG|nr:hypothetical protein LPJ61_005768 [Coemansia biformis]